MSDRERRGIKRPSLEESLARLQKNARLAKGKGKEVGQPSKAVAPPAPAKTAVPSVVTSSRQVVRQEARSDRPREDRPKEDRPRVDRSREERPREERPAGRHDTRSSRPRDDPSIPDSSTHRAIVSKFAEHLSVEVAESSKRSDHIEAISECATGLIGVSIVSVFIFASKLVFFFFFFFF